ncbi:RWP-RK domain-containing protein [Klebsormidium nitens]|uniref:RWP-RK domain-containing protein n=1 Tax=Klebsormidium nitens TaxID=105231 RepID=A0A1Y1HQG1_KLENI|nr:RWP-RK domain-containing protein [Klebsormidium nitens]|eukprot:GAQ80865.1 RWP-RK domain-containing protein [Klebsormidium nitens]
MGLAVADVGGESVEAKPGFKLVAIAIFQDQNMQEDIRSVQVYLQGGQYMALQQGFCLSPTGYYPLHEPIGMFFTNEADSLRFMARKKAEKDWACILDYAEYLPPPMSLNPLLSPTRNPRLKQLPTLESDLAQVEAAIEYASHGSEHSGTSSSVPEVGVPQRLVGGALWPETEPRGYEELFLPTPSPQEGTPSEVERKDYSLDQRALDSLLLSPRAEFLTAFQRPPPPPRVSSSGALSSAHALAAAPPRPQRSNLMLPPHSSTPELSPLRALLAHHGDNPLPGGSFLQPFSANQPPPPRTTLGTPGQTARIARPLSTEGLVSPRYFDTRGAFASSGGLVSTVAAVPVGSETSASDALASHRAPASEALSGVKEWVKVSFDSPEKRGRPPKTEVDLESIREFIRREAKRPMLPGDQGTARNDQSVYQSLHADNLLLQIGLENPSPQNDWRTSSDPGGAQQRGELGMLFRACSEPAFLSPGKSPEDLDARQLNLPNTPGGQFRGWEHPPGDSPFAGRAVNGLLAQGFEGSAHMRRPASEPNLGAFQALGANQGLVSSLWQPGNGVEVGPFEPGTLEAAESARLNIAEFLHSLPPSRGGATPRKAAVLMLEDLTPYFDMPMADACKALGVGATVLKRRCRELDIPRWPYRKVKSIDGLIQTIRELGDGNTSQQVENALERLAGEKKRIAEQPSLGMAQETKKFRQACFKASHKIRKKSYPGA